MVRLNILRPQATAARTNRVGKRHNARATCISNASLVGCQVALKVASIKLGCRKLLSLFGGEERERGGDIRFKRKRGGGEAGSGVPE